MPSPDRGALERELNVLNDVANRYTLAEDFDANNVRFHGQTIKDKIAGKSCLEVGCGDGTMTEILVEAAATLHVVDASTRYLAMVAEKLGSRARLFESLFEDFVPPQRYEAIVCAHVLEHVLDPVALIARMGTWLQTDGVMYLLVPNALSVHRMLGVEMGLHPDVHDLSPRDHALGHKRVYDPDSLARDICEAGLEPGELSGILFKPFHNALMDKIPPDVVQGLERLGTRFPRHAAAIQYECRHLQAAR